MKTTRILVATTVLASTLTVAVAHADGTPPPDLASAVAAPKSSAGAPPPVAAIVPDRTTASFSAGALASGGNARMVAGNATEKFELIADKNAYAASLVGNYGESAASQNAPLLPTIQNLQGRLRYDRYLLPRLSVFVIGTFRHDRFQGLAMRTNIDPGVKLLVVKTAATNVWIEGGYDFQFDIRNWLGRQQTAPVLSTATTTAPEPGHPGDTVTTVTTTYGAAPAPLALTATDHSARAFAGWKQVFTSTIAFATGVEYLQSVVHSQNARLNYDALLTANVVGGIAVGVGFTARFDNDPLPDKKNWDATGTLSIVYALNSTVVPPPK